MKIDVYIYIYIYKDILFLL